MTDFELIKEYLPFLIPAVLIELALAITGVISVLRHPHYRFGNRVLWLLLVIFVQPFGPLLYFFAGREVE